MASNGRLTNAELTPIRGSRLSVAAANSWKAEGGPERAGLQPTNYDCGYRDLAAQEHYWWLYKYAGGNLAAYPGTSNHGWGIAVDLPNAWEQDWIWHHGAQFGWKKTEAFSEPWHFNYVGSQHFPEFVTLKHGAQGRRVRMYCKRLMYIRGKGGKRYLNRKIPESKFRVDMVKAVRFFQRDHGLHVDGVIGPETAAVINAAWHHQWHKFHPRSKHGH